MKVLKFGGSSVGDADRIDNVCRIIRDAYKKDKKITVVVSAMQTITDKLIFTANVAKKDEESFTPHFESIRDLHIGTAKKLISEKKIDKVLAKINNDLNELYDLLNGVRLVGELSIRTLDYIMSFGERFSAYMISEALNDRGVSAEYADARRLIFTDMNYGSAKVDFDKTNEMIKQYFKKTKRVPIVTGFIALTHENETTTLGRGGSDYTAAIIGAALNAETIEIWTDVDGVLTADPKKVEKAFSIDAMTYAEAMEMSHFGAKVIHPPTILPAMKKGIPIYIKNSFNPSFKGTYINTKPKNDKFDIKGITSIDDISLIRILGAGMVGASGASKRIFATLDSNKISVVLITQANSEQSICVAVSPKDALKAKVALEETFKYDIFEGKIAKIELENDISIIAVVSEKLGSTVGVSGKICQSLGKNGVNIVAIALGSSALNFSLAIHKSDVSKALNVLHDVFFYYPAKSMNLFLAGTGLIGGTLLKQINERKDALLKDFNIDMKIIGLINADNMIINPEGIVLNGWKDTLSKKGSKANLNNFVESIRTLNLPNSVFIDCTPSESIIKFYKEIMESSISIVAANKKANSDKLELYKKLKETANRMKIKFLYETNVCAGLPIINVINDLVNSGDKIIKLEGILSGTLSYIFNNFSGEKTFSEIVSEAKEKGYTEPDPREDLNGKDVARKLLILIRESGYDCELNDISLQNLIPVNARKAKNVDEFFKKLKTNDEYFEKLRNEAQKKGKVLRYSAKYEDGKAEIKLAEFDQSYPFYTMKGTDNILAMTTERYNDTPLVVRGPGAGAGVTAAGVFADIIKISNYLS